MFCQMFYELYYDWHGSSCLSNTNAPFSECLDMLIYVDRGYSVTVLIGVGLEYFLARVS
jgi:hypothetical protein